MVVVYAVYGVFSSIANSSIIRFISITYVQGWLVILVCRIHMFKDGSIL